MVKGSNDLRWMNFPRSKEVTDLGRGVIAVFQEIYQEISSEEKKLHSNEVLAIARPGLRKLGFRVEEKGVDKITVPVLFGLNGNYDKVYEADAWHPEKGFVVEIEAGRAIDNNQFLKDLIQASVMVGVDHLAVACRNKYRGSDNFEKITNTLETIFVSGRLILPMKTILIVGY